MQGSATVEGSERDVRHKVEEPCWRVKDLSSVKEAKSGELYGWDVRQGPTGRKERDGRFGRGRGVPSRSTKKGT